MSNQPTPRPQFTTRDILWLCILISVVTLCSRSVYHAEQEYTRLINVVNSIDSDLELYHSRVVRQSQRITELEKRDAHILDCWFFTLFRFGEAPRYDGYMLAVGDWAMTVQGLNRVNGCKPEFSIYFRDGARNVDLFTLEFP